MQLKTKHPRPRTNHRYRQKHGWISQAWFQGKEGRPQKKMCPVSLSTSSSTVRQTYLCVRSWEGGYSLKLVGWWLGGYDNLLGSWGREGWECCVSWVQVLVALVFGLKNFIGCILWLVHLSTSMLCINKVYLKIFMGSCIVQTKLDSRESSKINGEETLPIMRWSIRHPSGYRGLAGWPQARDPISLRDRRTGSHFPICKLRLLFSPVTPSWQIPFSLFPPALKETSPPHHMSLCLFPLRATYQIVVLKGKARRGSGFHLLESHSPPPEICRGSMKYLKA